jgi:hypothetical protein
MEVALRSSRTRTTVPSMIRRTIGSSASERAGRCIPKPIAFQARIKGSLETEQGFKWIAETRDHDCTPQMRNGCRGCEG